jgi:hypothetical protein
LPHIHVEYGDEKAVLSIPDGTLIMIFLMPVHYKITSMKIIKSVEP